MTPIKVLLADDHLMVREGLRQILELEEDLEVVGEVGDGIQCIDEVYNLTPDILLLDINMPKLNGIEVLKMLREKKNGTKIIVLTFYSDIEILEEAIEFGANGFVLKESESSLLKKAINVVYNGEKYIQPSLAAVMRKRQFQKSSNLSILTKRELQVLKLVVEGLYNKEIAYQLNISEKTVKNHISNIFRKIDVSDRTQAAVYAIRNNLVSI
ncbi:response regulator [Anaeromicropila populeti]|uniref:Stage 0 sporulation protein A homolog n=1 Tax=Anaeromicropila populeti TaxID=37658 RepID=A0A1I6LMG3_9FIRM|nr:response regulator transcription factor [Anaeromicropila populeti]SFS04674.1 two component transcriptional regulator, LuxR family [Anaeromicropila populeti]